MSRFPRLFGASGKGEPDYRAEYHRLLRIQEILKAIISERNLRTVLSRIMDSVVDLTGAERGFLILRRDGGREIATARNIDKEEVRRPDFKISHSIAEKVMSTGEGLVARNALLETPLSLYSSVATLRLKSVLCVPFRLRDEVVGALYIDHRFEEGKFDSVDLAAIEAFADQAAIAIENARLHEENERSRKSLEALNEELRGRIEATESELAEARRQREASAAGSGESPLRHDYSPIVGRGPAIRRVLELLDRITDTTIPVLVLGESGTGKELVARVLHANGPRKEEPFIAENCSAIPETLMESELFGSAKGAFTGADRDRAGVFEQAHRGTLFLDEIGELRLDLQGKLLRVLQENEVRRVGGSERVKIDIRLIAASNKDIAEEVRAGRFREDLYYRLKGVVVTLPPLRERREDVPLLVAHALEAIGRERGEPPREIAPEIVRQLARCDWPGNVRQLLNEVRRLVALSPGRVEDPSLLDELRNSGSPARSGARGNAFWSGRTLEDVEREMISRVLEECGGRKGDAASRLGLPRRTLFDKIKRYGLEGS